MICPGSAKYLLTTNSAKRVTYPRMFVCEYCGLEFEMDMEVWTYGARIDDSNGTKILHSHLDTNFKAPEGGR